MNFSQIEQKILEFWKEKKIFEKSLQKGKGRKNFVFFEGPPTANGRPGMHHVEARAFKDIIPRYKTMRGFFVDRKAGWDTHGLPVELEVEKELGLKNKKEIEKYGIDKFNAKCKESVWKYKDEWEKLTERIAFWLDMKNPYITYENYYIESVWFILKKIWEKGLMYKGFKVVPHCPRCVTTLSSHEVAQGYKKVKDPSIFVKFPVKGEKETYFLVWTTTPWTLPANVGLAVNPNIEYILLESPKGKFWIADSLATKIISSDVWLTIYKKKGKDLVGLKYEPLFKNPNHIPSKARNQGSANEVSGFFKENDLRVVAGDFVSTEEGTGIVHLAPAYGEDDLRVGEKEKLSVIHTVDNEGIVMSGYGIPGEGKFVKDADEDIVADLRKRELLFAEKNYEHDYPHCWRCDSPLLYYAKDSWFIRMSDLRDKLVANNKKINWEPEYIQEGRFGEFLCEVKDWAISRERYWGIPLPIWICEKCSKQKAVGSVQELNKLQTTNYKLQDLHRPFIDEIKLKCECKGKMARTLEVIDVWFDSGAMPFAQWGYPETKGSDKEFKAHFPADYISEAIDQTRGWFYTLLAVATLMEHCGVAKSGAPYKNVICLGHVLDKHGKKMSKSRGNVVDPWEMCEKFGADTLRWYLYTVNQAGDPKKFDVKDVQDKNRRIFGTLYNSLIFFQTYAEKDFVPKSTKSKNILDKWIVSVFNSCVQEVIDYLEKYDVVSAAREIENFIDDFSNWHIRRSRERFQRPKNAQEKNEAAQTLYSTLLELSKLIAPFAPFMAEEIYQQLAISHKQFTISDSVHLCDYPKPDKKLMDKKLEDSMKQAREIVAKALALRMEKKIKIRQPLAKLKIKNEKLKIDDQLTDLIKDEVNVKSVVFSKKIKDEIELDAEISEELKEEGLAREIVRQIQQMRKEAGLVPQDVISIMYNVSSIKYQEIFKKWAKYIKQETNSKSLEPYKEGKKFDLEKEINLQEGKIKIGIIREIL